MADRIIDVTAFSVSSGASGVTRLSETPLIHETASVHDSQLGRYTEISERCRISEATLGDYSYIMQDGAVWCARIGKFANIAASVRINAPNHPDVASHTASFHLSFRRLLGGRRCRRRIFRMAPDKSRHHWSRCVDRSRRNRFAGGERRRRGCHRCRGCRLQGCRCPTRLSAVCRPARSVIVLIEDTADRLQSFGLVGLGSRKIAQWLSTTSAHWISRHFLRSIRPEHSRYTVVTQLK